MPTVPRGASSGARVGRLNRRSFLAANRLGASDFCFLWPAPFSQRLPVMKRRPPPKSLMVS